MTNDPLLKRFGLVSQSQKMKYDKFVSLYMVNCKAEVSYSEVYPDNKNPKSIKKSTYVLLRHPYVVYQLNKRNKEIDAKMDEKIIMNRDRILNELEEILIKSKKKESYNVSLKALDQLSRVLGAYAPEKSEVDHKGITIKYVKPDKKKK